jgi:hypothetical protein
MAESRTYRRVPQDINEVQYIKGLIDADVKARAGELATSNVDALRVLLNTQQRWAEIEASLQTDAVERGVAAFNEHNPPKDSPLSQPDKEVKPEPRPARAAATKPPTA